MVNQVLWRKLTETDFNAMNGMASPYGAGGGARHIALGVNNSSFPIEKFLGGTYQIQALPPAGVAGNAELAFLSNPERRGGEWLIRDQFNHRHPAWTAAAKFPKNYSSSDPPYIFVFRSGKDFFARFAAESTLRSFVADLPSSLFAKRKGIGVASDALLRRFGILQSTLLDLFEEKAPKVSIGVFNPADVEDGRRKIMTEVVRRQGQPAFRKSLLQAYGGRCAVSRSRLIWILEAAHISPYRGPKTNHVSNGLLLRADVHTLFDLGLISVEPKSHMVQTSSLLDSSGYEKLAGRKILLPRTPADRPSSLALEEHFSRFRR